MSSVASIETLIHEARVQQIQGDRETAIKCYMTIIATVSSLLEKCSPEEKVYLETTLSNIKTELELVRSLEKQETEEVTQPVYERIPSIASNATDDSMSIGSVSTIASVPKEEETSASASKHSFKETWERGMKKCRVFFKRPYANPFTKRPRASPSTKCPHASPSTKHLRVAPSEEKSSTSYKKSCCFSKMGPFFCAMWNGMVVFARCTTIIFTQFFTVWKGVFTKTKPTN